MSVLGNMIASAAYFKFIRGYQEDSKIMFENAINRGVTKKSRLAPYAIILMRQGDFEKAIDISTQIIDSDPKPPIKGRIRANRAICNTKLERYEEAKEELEDLNEVFRSVCVYESLGYLYLLMGDEKAEEYNLEANDYISNNYVVLDNLCQYYLQKEDYENARLYGEQAYDVDENKVDNLYHMALIEAHDKNMEKAQRYCKKMMFAPLSTLNDITDEMRLEAYKNIMGKDFEED